MGRSRIRKIGEIEGRYCSRCDTFKPLSEYSKRGTGYRCECRACRNTDEKNRRIAKKKTLTGQYEAKLTAKDAVIEKLEKKLDIAVEGLEFYGNESSWKSAGNNRAKTLIINDRRGGYPAFQECGGDRARQAISKIKETKC